jgi:hypothetical protein
MEKGATEKDVLEKDGKYSLTINLYMSDVKTKPALFGFTPN